MKAKTESKDAAKMWGRKREVKIYGFVPVRGYKSIII